MVTAMADDSLVAPVVATGRRPLALASGHRPRPPGRTGTRGGRRPDQPAGEDARGRPPWVVAGGPVYARFRTAVPEGVGAAGTAAGQCAAIAAARKITRAIGRYASGVRSHARACCPGAEAAPPMAAYAPRAKTGSPMTMSRLAIVPLGETLWPNAADPSARSTGTSTSTVNAMRATARPVRFVRYSAPGLASAAGPAPPTPGPPCTPGPACNGTTGGWTVGGCVILVV